MNARPFKVINCLSQGFAVAGPPPQADGVDLEMIHWGLPADQARALADDLNAPPRVEHVED